MARALAADPLLLPGPPWVGTSLDRGRCPPGCPLSAHQVLALGPPVTPAEALRAVGHLPGRPGAGCAWPGPLRSPWDTRRTEAPSGRGGGGRRRTQMHRVVTPDTDGHLPGAVVPGGRPWVAEPGLPSETPASGLRQRQVRGTVCRVLSRADGSAGEARGAQAGCRGSVLPREEDGHVDSGLGPWGPCVEGTEFANQRVQRGRQQGDQTDADEATMPQNE